MLDDNLVLIGAVGAAICLVGVLYALFGSSGGPPSVLPHEKDFCKYPLLNKESLSHDTRKFTFGLPAGHVLGLPTGQHMTMKLVDPVDGKTHQRSYTPVTDNSDVGVMSFVIKIYKAGVHPKFPEGGKMSQHLDSLEIGDLMEMKGPKGHLDYKKGGNFTVKPLGKPMETRQTNQILMIAGGTGITPMLQILQFIFKNPGDPTIQVRLIYANQSVDDILVQDILEGLQKDFPDRFTLHYTVDRAPTTGTWKGSVGFISKEMIAAHGLFNSSSQKTQVFMCGPPPMIKFACVPNLKELGFNDKDMVVF